MLLLLVIVDSIVSVSSSFSPSYSAIWMCVWMCRFCYYCCFMLYFSLVFIMFYELTLDGLLSTTWNSNKCLMEFLLKAKMHEHVAQTPFLCIFMYLSVCVTHSTFYICGKTFVFRAITMFTFPRYGSFYFKIASSLTPPKTLWYGQLNWTNNLYNSRIEIFNIKECQKTNILKLSK